MSRKHGMIEVTNIEDCIDLSIEGLDDYFKKSKQRWITANLNNIGKIRPDRETKLGNRNGKNNNSTNISSNKLEWEHMRYIATKMTQQKKSLISFDSSTKY